MNTHIVFHEDLAAAIIDHGYRYPHDSEREEFTRRRILMVYGDGEGGAGIADGIVDWTPLERVQAVAAVQLGDPYGGTLMACDLPAGHPFMATPIIRRYPHHFHMPSMDTQVEFKTEFPQSEDDAKFQAQLLAVREELALKTEVPSLREPWRGSEQAQAERQRIIDQLHDNVAAVTGGAGSAEWHASIARAAAEFYTNLLDPALCGVIVDAEFPGTIAATQNTPAKPMLLVPDGCVLVIPDTEQPWEFLARYDTSHMAPTALVVNRSGYETMKKAAEQMRTECASAERTAAALSFEQPIQSRLGRMAK